MCNGSSFSISSPMFDIFCVFDYSYSSVHKIVCYCGLNLHFPNFPKAHFHVSYPFVGVYAPFLGYPASHNASTYQHVGSKTWSLASIGAILKNSSQLEVFVSLAKASVKTALQSSFLLPVLLPPLLSGCFPWESSQNACKSQSGSLLPKESNNSRNRVDRSH